MIEGEEKRMITLTHGILVSLAGSDEDHKNSSYEEEFSTALGVGVAFGKTLCIDALLTLSYSIYKVSFIDITIGVSCSSTACEFF